MTTSALRGPRGSFGSLVLLTGFLGIVLAMGVTRSSADGPTDHGTPMLEVVTTRLPASADASRLPTALQALGQTIAKQSGLVSTTNAVAVGTPATLLRATIWDSVENAEAASLALDGSPAQVELQRAVASSDGAVAHFRRLREHEYSQEATGHLEVTVFRTRPGTTREAHLEKFDAAESGFLEGEGVLGHSLWIAPDGRWVHLVRWRSAADFQTTAKALMTVPSVTTWIRSLDYQRFQVLHGDVLP